jgi:uncharacterized protein
MFLLDVNMLIAVADPDHEHHERAKTYFLAHHRSGWATCPLTENGFIRIVGHPRSYPKGPGSTDGARDILIQLCAHAGHYFWPDDLSLRGPAGLPASQHLTDYYLLSLAVHRRGRLVTLDRRIQADRVSGGAGAYVVV